MLPIFLAALEEGTTLAEGPATEADEAWVEAAEEGLAEAVTTAAEEARTEEEPLAVPRAH